MGRLCNDQSEVSAEAHGKNCLMHQPACVLCWACRAPPCTTGCVLPLVQVVKEAEADAEAKYLQGVGVARQRQVCCMTFSGEGLKYKPT